MGFNHIWMVKKLNFYKVACDNFKVAENRQLSTHKRRCEISGLNVSAENIREVFDIH